MLGMFYQDIQMLLFETKIWWDKRRLHLQLKQVSVFNFKNGIFTVKKYKDCFSSCNNLDYVSDSHGFALLKLWFDEVRVHSYDSAGELFPSSMRI